MTALVTGIGGQDGHYLSRLLAEKGCRVAGLIRCGCETESLRARLPGVEMHRAHLSDLSFLIGLLEEIQPREIYHLAADSFVPASWRRPLATAQTNGLNVVHLLEAVRRVNPEIRFFQASSSDMFAGGSERRIDELTPLSPLNPYSAAKALAHGAAVNYREAYGMFVCCGILFNHESPRRSVRYVTRKITRAAARISLGLESELPLGDLDAGRDWGYAGDFVGAMWSMLQAERAGDYVIGTGRAHSVAEFAETAFARVGLDWRRHVRIDPALARPPEGPPLTAAAQKAERELGWTAETGFEELVGMMVDADLVLARRELEGSPP